MLCGHFRAALKQGRAKTLLKTLSIHSPRQLCRKPWHPCPSFLDAPSRLRSSAPFLTFSHAFTPFHPLTHSCGSHLLSPTATAHPRQLSIPSASPRTWPRIPASPRPPGRHAICVPDLHAFPLRDAPSSAPSSRPPLSHPAFGTPSLGLPSIPPTPWAAPAANCQVLSHGLPT